MIQKTIFGLQVNSLEKWDRLLWNEDIQISALWLPAIHPGDVVIDAGCGPGGWTLVALARGATVYAFDPKPYCSQILSEVLDVNAFKDKCTFVQMGLKDTPGQIFYEKQWYPATSIDAYMADKNPQRIDHIAVDVEGFEMDVIKGARETIRQFHPRMVIEVHHHLGVSWDALEAELKSLANYACERFFDNSIVATWS